MAEQKRLRELLAELAPYFNGVLAARNNFALAQECGLHVTPNHFYYPIPDTVRLPPVTWTTASEMPGIDIDEIDQLDLMNRVLRTTGRISPPSR